MALGTPTVGILIVDDDRDSQAALRELLGSEGWRLGITSVASEALPELATGEWSLVIINVAMSGLEGPVYDTLKELAQAPPVEGESKRARVLFLVPELAGRTAQPVLERERLPYALKPFHLHDFLEKVSDLLMETSAITDPIRRVKQLHGGPDLRDGRRAERERMGAHSGGRSTNMFASRTDYQMTEEEIAEYERQEQEQEQARKKKKQPGESGLG
ncbi:MAG: two-component system response regulator [Candidatus Acidiferrales bacterium]